MGKSLEVALTSEMASRGGDPIDIKMCELALHYLTPPASSVDIERLFSTAADNTTNDRHIYISPSTLISSFKKRGRKAAVLGLEESNLWTS